MGARRGAQPRARLELDCRGGRWETWSESVARSLARSSRARGGYWTERRTRRRTSFGRDRIVGNVMSAPFA